MSEACSTHGCGRKIVPAGFWWRNLKENEHLEDLDMNGNLIFNWI
jgi:hypothetical protein